MSILRVKDDQGNYVEIPAIKGEPGASGVIDATTESALTGLLKGAGGHIAPAVAGTDYVAPADMAAKQNKITASGLLKGDGAGGITAAVAGTDYVAPVSMEAKQNKITASGLLKGNGSGGVTAAVIGTDYAPAIDYIVDQGTSGIWYYRKWNSGVAECWGTQTNVSGTFADWGNIYSYDIPSVSFPSGLFTAQSKMLYPQSMLMEDQYQPQVKLPVSEVQLRQAPTRLPLTGTQSAGGNKKGVII